MLSRRPHLAKPGLCNPGVECEQQGRRGGRLRENPLTHLQRALNTPLNPSIPLGKSSCSTLQRLYTDSGYEWRIILLIVHFYEWMSKMFAFGGATPNKQETAVLCLS